MAPKKEQLKKDPQKSEAQAWEGPLIYLEVSVDSSSPLFVSCQAPSPSPHLFCSGTRLTFLSILLTSSPRPLRMKPQPKPAEEGAQTPPNLPAQVKVGFAGAPAHGFQSSMVEAAEDGTYAFALSHRVAHPFNHESLEVRATPRLCMSRVFGNAERKGEGSSRGCRGNTYCGRLGATRCSHGRIEMSKGGGGQHQMWRRPRDAAGRGRSRDERALLSFRHGASPV